MKSYGLPILILITGLLYIFIIPDDPFWFKLLWKLIPMWLILLYAYLRMPDHKGKEHWIIWGGLFFCMLGDGLLVWFVVGLFAFLIGHLFYVAGFSRFWSFSQKRFFAIVPLLLYAIFIGWRMTTALLDNDQQSLIVPVLLYVLVISTMTFTAIMTGHRWLMLGSLLFMISDSILAWNRFIEDVPFSGPLIMITYYSAQFLIAHGIRHLIPKTPSKSTHATVS